MGEIKEDSYGAYYGSGSFTLRVTSDDFDSWLSQDKILFLNELDEIRFSKYGLHVKEEVESNGGIYKLGEDKRVLYRDSFQMYPIPSSFNSPFSSSSTSSSTCDILWINLDDALLLSGGETTDLTVYYTKALMDNDCFDLDD